MKRICLFAGFNKNNKIEDYVVYYLKELSTISEVYYMADNEISDEEKSKIMPYVKYADGYKHESYDLGSWSILVNKLGWDKLSEYDELILANDSVCGPLYKMDDFIYEVEKDIEWDICGIDRAYNQEMKIYFLSNYFLIFRNKTFLTDIFKNHINNTIKNAGRNDIINTYEVPFMKKFYSNGYIVKSVLSQDVNVYDQWLEAVKSGSPFIKIKGLLGNNTKISDIIYINKNYDYPLKLIKKLIIKRITKNIRQNLIRFHIGKGKTNIKILGINIIRHENIYNTPIDEAACPIKKINNYNKPLNNMAVKI
ncbi:MAG TPA: hypothetical protein H9804_00620 [Candidatus Mucispirillum faecigallinarum]|uniref:Uncharacterized protein n=1 Tax=Candidatus Mucispirillum faecigallinarum TaxID=2838699 RepID=A0A9D2GSY3_9BACT|nr:hypothetical protein [Candidatus Mucispirillum faecigallinarum]